MPSDTLSTEVKPVKNAFGLPTGELNSGSLFEEEVEEQEVVEVEEEETFEPEPVEEEVVEVEEESEPEEDFLALTLDEPEEPVSEESEMDKLRRQLLILEGRLEEQSRLKDQEIRQEAEATPDEEDLDFSNPQFREAITEKLQEDPSLMPVLVQEMVDRKLNAMRKKLEAYEAKAQETDVSIEQANTLKKNFYDGLLAAQELGDLERKLVEEISVAAAAKDPNKSHVLRYLQQNPHFANSAEGIKAAVTNLAATARANARKKGIDISTVSKSQASDRSNRMMEKQTKPSQEEDWETEKINRLMSKGKSPLDGLLKGR